MPVQRSSTTQVRTAVVTTFTRPSLASWHLPLLLAMALANPGSKLRLDSGTEPEQFRVDTPGDEVWIYWLRVILFVPELSTIHAYRIVAVPLCNICAAFLLVTLFPF